MSNRGTRESQRGYVTVFIAVLFGLAFTATVLGSAAYIRSTEAVSLASHAQVQAQLKAWTGVEIVREYLASLQSTGNLTAMAGVVAATPNLALTINGVTGVAATLVSVDSGTNPSVFTAQITGSTASGTRAQATSTIQAVYSVSSGGSSNMVPALNFDRSLALGGSISITPANSSTKYSINVLGDVSTSGNSITGVNTINATGTINIGSGSSFQQLNSNCDVVISGSVQAATINAQRNICETGSAASSALALANGSVSTQSSESANGTISALVHPTPASSCSAEGASQNGTTAATCPVPSVNGVDLSAGSAGAAYVNTEGNVVLSSGAIGKLYAAGNLDVTSSGSVGSGTVGSLTKPSWNSSVNVTPVSGYTVNITPAVAVTLQTSQFNATTLQPVANYSFSVNSSGFVQVQVYDVNGISNGTYYLGNYGGGYQDYLCTAVSGTEGSTWSEPTCTAPAVTAAPKICQGQSSYNSCFTVTTTAGVSTFSIDGTSMVPGIVYFAGNLDLKDGTYYDTFIATYNITTSNSDTVYAVNFAGYSGTSGGVQYAPTGICTNSYFPRYYPLDFCNTSTATFDSTAAAGVGNYALLDGSWTGSSYPGQGGYLGGNVEIGSSSYIYGDIKAGNAFKSDGNANVAGIVSALAQGSTVWNSMGGSTSFNYSKIPPTEDITGGATSNETETSTPGTISIEWTKYL